MKKSLEYLQEGERILRACDHMIYVTYPLIKDKKLLLKITLELKKSLAYLINATLHLDHVYKRVSLRKNPKENLQNYLTKSSKRMGLGDAHRKKIIELFEIALLHKESPMTFVRDEKIVILTKQQDYTIITVEKTKEYAFIIKEILEKTKQQFTTLV